MKLKLIPLFTILIASFVSINQGFAQSFPNCASAVSDSDGDGFGFENGQSCLVVNQQITTVSLPNCASADSDSDGDGFGFENGQSCLVVDGQAMQGEVGQCIDTDGDGFGWNGVATCDPSMMPVTQSNSLAEEIAGVWNCQNSYLASPAFNPSGSNNRSDEVTSATWQIFQDNMSGQGGSTIRDISRFEFTNTGDVTIQSSFSEFDNTWLNTNTATWSVDNFTLNIAPDETGFSLRITALGFEDIDEVETFHMFRTTSLRFSCTR